MSEDTAVFSFYNLIDPRDDLPFYIGQTLSFERRQQEHLVGRPHSAPLARRMKELEELGLQPIMCELERRECTQEEALRREAYWIQRLSSQGISLLNRSNNKGRHKQLTVYLPPALSKWLKMQAVEEDREIGEVMEDALKLCRDQVS